MKPGHTLPELVDGAFGHFRHQDGPEKRLEHQEAQVDRHDDAGPECAAAKGNKLEGKSVARHGANRRGQPAETNLKVGHDQSHQDG
jgi:hypothetical protein